MYYLVSNLVIYLFSSLKYILGWLKYFLLRYTQSLLFLITTASSL